MLFTLYSEYSEQQFVAGRADGKAIDLSATVVISTYNTSLETSARRADRYTPSPHPAHRLRISAVQHVCVRPARSVSINIVHRYTATHSVLDAHPPLYSLQCSAFPHVEECPLVQLADKSFHPTRVGPTFVPRYYNMTMIHDLSLSRPAIQRTDATWAGALYLYISLL